MSPLFTFFIVIVAVVVYHLLRGVRRELAWRTHREELDLVMNHGHMHCLCCSQVNPPGATDCDACGASLATSDHGRPVLLYSGRDGYAFGYRLGAELRRRDGENASSK